MGQNSFLNKMQPGISNQEPGMFNIHSFGIANRLLIKNPGIILKLYSSLG